MFPGVFPGYPLRTHVQSLTYRCACLALTLYLQTARDPVFPDLRSQPRQYPSSHFLPCVAWNSEAHTASQPSALHWNLPSRSYAMHRVIRKLISHRVHDQVLRHHAVNRDHPLVILVCASGELSVPPSP